ncbi:ribonuclease H-like domain-containing protein [Tanacetum coccineum]|uniref:Ribonuclease H-like domain-containing protein n=1 Tax=Tanacetum coccineum TaxID=301880 RepID=A0ABQ5AKV3_9ASTR
MKAACDATKKLRRFKVKTDGVFKFDRVMLKGFPWKWFYYLANERELKPQIMLDRFKCWKESYIDKPFADSLEGLYVDDKLYFVEEPVKIMDREVYEARVTLPDTLFRCDPIWGCYTSKMRKRVGFVSEPPPVKKARAEGIAISDSRCYFFLCHSTPEHVLEDASHDNVRTRPSSDRFVVLSYGSMDTNIPSSPQVALPVTSGSAGVNVPAAESVSDGHRSPGSRSAAGDLSAAPNQDSSADEFYESQTIDSASAQNVYVPNWNVTNDARINDSVIYQNLLDHVTPSGYWAALRNQHDVGFLDAININSAQYVCMVSELRLRYKHEIITMEKFEKKFIDSAALVQQRDAEIADLRVRLHKLFKNDRICTIFTSAPLLYQQQTSYPKLAPAYPISDMTTKSEGDLLDTKEPIFGCLLIMDPVTLDATLLATQGSQQILVSFSREITRIAIDFLTPRSSTSEKGKQHRASYDYNRFTWVFFLATKDETSCILKSFIIRIENLVDHKVKVIRCDNGTEFKNREMNQFCKMKGILRQFSVARTPQQNGVAERRNRTLIEAARTMLADSKLLTTFWAKAVNTACYVQNRVLVVKPHNKTPYELFHGRTPTLSFMRPFGCPVTILNTIDHLGKFDGKVDESFFIGYSLNSKTFRVFNSKTRIVKENLHIRFSESTPNVVGSEPDWLFDIDTLTRTMNYEPIIAGTQSNGFAGTKASDNVGQARKETEPVKDYILLPLWTADPPYSQDEKSSHDDGSKPSSDDGKKVDEDPRKDSECNDQEKEDNVNNTNNVNTVRKAKKSVKLMMEKLLRMELELMLFWSTVKAKTINGEEQLHALVDGKKIIITESSVRRDLQLADEEGVDCLPNSTIFEQLTLMGPKTTDWNKFSSTMASAIICLATN